MSDFNFEQAGYADLLAEAKRLNEVVRDLTGTLDSTKQELARVQLAFQNRDRQRDAVSEVIQELVDNKTISDPEAIAILCKNLDVSAERTVSFSLNITVSGSIELGYDETLDDYGFCVESLSYNGTTLSDWMEDDVEVEWDED